MLTLSSNLEFGHFALLFDWERQRNVPNFITHVQRHCISLINLSFCDVLVPGAVAVVCFEKLSVFQERRKLEENCMPGSLDKQIMSKRQLSLEIVSVALHCEFNLNLF